MVSFRTTFVPCLYLCVLIATADRLSQQQVYTTNNSPCMVVYTVHVHIAVYWLYMHVLFVCALAACTLCTCTGCMHSLYVHWLRALFVRALAACPLCMCTGCVSSLYVHWLRVLCTDCMLCVLIETYLITNKTDPINSALDWQRLQKNLTK